MIAREPIRTFDLFDTLVARRCVYPRAIFSLTESRIGLVGFADARVAAERSVATGTYSLKDIYDELARCFRISDHVATEIMRAELAVEFENLFCIREHCSQVQQPDLIVSDMYLPYAFLSRVLTEICGLPFNTLVLSANGKRSGAAWVGLLNRFEILQHIGDDAITDFESPTRYAIPAKLTRVAQRTQPETFFADHNLEPIANIMREARLTAPESEGSSGHAQLIQIQGNFPLLFLASLYLMRMAQSNRWAHLLFSSRDCYLWSRLFSVIASASRSDVECKYFYTSRVAKAHPSPEYLAYFRSVRRERTSVIVDVCGTGWSSRRLIENAGGPQTEVFLIHKMHHPDLQQRYEKLGSLSEPKEINSIVDSGDNSSLEMANCALHGMVTDVVRVQGAFRPVFLPTDYGDDIRKLIESHHNAFFSAMRLTQQLTRHEYENMLCAADAGAVGRAYHQLAQYRAHLKPLFDHQEAEERQVWHFLMANSMRSNIEMGPNMENGSRPETITTPSALQTPDNALRPTKLPRALDR